jgi:hypothetical protein
MNARERFDVAVDLAREQLDDGSLSHIALGIELQLWRKEHFGYSLDEEQAWRGELSQ